jgi:hypothetical protein
MRPFIAVVEVRGGSRKAIQALNKISGECGALSERRNRVVHDPRLVNRDSQEVHRLDITARPKPHFGFEPESIDEQRKLYDQIYDVVTRFSKLRDQAIAEIESLPLEFQPQLAGVIELRDASVAQPSQ